MSAADPLKHVLDVLAEWSEGFALSFVFSDTARSTGLTANVLACADLPSAHSAVEGALALVAASHGPVVLDFRGCPPGMLADSARRLNERRSMLEKLGHPLVIVCPERERLAVQYAAPDLWHIRTVVPGAPSENESS